MLIMLREFDNTSILPYQLFTTTAFSLCAFTKLQKVDCYLGHVRPSSCLSGRVSYLPSAWNKSAPTGPIFTKLNI